MSWPAGNKWFPVSWREKLALHYLHDVELVVGGAAKLSTIAFMPDLSNNGHGLLGQFGFFDRFHEIRARKVHY
jgi:hypothetical protein